MFSVIQVNPVYSLSELISTELTISWGCTVRVYNEKKEKEMPMEIILNEKFGIVKV